MSFTKKTKTKILFSLFGVIMLYICALTSAIDIDNISTDDLPLLSHSTLSQADQEKAISFFESQHDSWLAITSGTAKYQTQVRNIVQGELVDDPNHAYTGTFEFVVTPLDDPVKHQSPVRVKARLSNNNYNLNVLWNNFSDSEAFSWSWTDGSPLGEEEIKKIRKWVFKPEMFFFPLDFMSKSYRDGLWHNKYTEPKESFFPGRGIPRRLSTQEETENAFAGEQQFLFMLSPALVDAHYWFSAENGELRQVDIFVPGDIKISFRYEDYSQQPAGHAKFPQRFVQTFTQGSGDNAIGWEYAVDITDLNLNVDIPTQRFVSH